MRRSAEVSHREGLQYARDRVLMGQQRVDGAVGRREGAHRYHEAGHAVRHPPARRRPGPQGHHPPDGHGPGRHQLPAEDRHSYNQEYLEQSIVVAMGGRIAERLVFGVVSTGANNDLVVSTEQARKMVRVGHEQADQADGLGLAGAVFLGEDLMSALVAIDETAGHRPGGRADPAGASKRCEELLTGNRNGLDLVARRLLEHETIDGSRSAGWRPRLGEPGAVAHARPPSEG
ncbi:MAG: hypothetical protein R2711_14120 [Acidimicrobiales bacterium]